jgi:hypothetical protein
MLMMRKCPWCGAEMELVVCDEEGNLHDKEYENDPWSGLGYKIRHPFVEEKHTDCPIEPATHAAYEGLIGTYIYPTKEDAIKTWNDYV